MDSEIKIMIVDDNRDFCEILKEYFDGLEDCVVSGVAYYGLQALEMLTEELPDVIILDLIMPHLDGIGVLENSHWNMVRVGLRSLFSLPSDRRL